MVHYANIRYERCQKLPDRGGGGSFNFTAEGSNPLTLPELSEADMHPPKNRYSCRVRGAGQVKKHSIPPELKNNITSNNFFVQKIYFQVPKTKVSLLEGFQQSSPYQLEQFQHIGSYLPEQVPANDFLFIGTVPPFLPPHTGLWCDT